MALKLNQADRTYMRHFFMGIAGLAIFSLIDVGIAAAIWQSQEKPNVAHEVAFAPGHRTPAFGEPAASAVTTPSAPATPAAAAASPAASAPAAPSPQASAATSPPPPAGAAPASAYAYTASQGESLFNGTCAACHQTSGAGIPGVFPPLKGNATVADVDPGAQIDTILAGRHGTVIGGQKYSGVMPAFASQFNDVQIADIANYERSSWGNHGKQVTPAEVAAARAKSK